MVIVFERGIWRRWLPVLLAFVPLILFVYLGQFSRMMSDDYCTIAVGQELGAWEGMRYWFDNWAGSYANFFLKSAVAPLDVILPRVMPAVIVVLWLAGLYWLLAQVLAWLPVDSPRRWAAAISALTIAAAINAFHSPQSFYWYAASTHYALPLAVLTLYAALALWTAQRAALSSAALLVGGLLCFISAGAAEIFVAFQAVFLSCCLLMALLLVRPAQRLRYVLVFGAGWLATLISLMIQLSAPGASARATFIVQTYGQPDRSLATLLSKTLGWTIEHIRDPDVIIGFLMLMALGLLITLLERKPRSTATAKPPALLLPAWLGFCLLVQLLFVPLLWAHTSDSPQLLGRFSPSYSVVICLNAAFILCFAVLIWQRKRINAHLQQYERSLWIICCTILFVFVFAILLLLTQIRNIHYRASFFLFMSAISVLATITQQIFSLTAVSSTSKLGWLGLLSYGTALLAIAVTLFLAWFGRGFVALRILTPSAYLLVFPGLIWGVYIGCLIKDNGLSSRLGLAWIKGLKFVSLIIVVVITTGIVLGQMALIPDFRIYAEEWDARHQSIIAMRAGGQTVIEVPPLPAEFTAYLRVSEPPDNPKDINYQCAERYYDVDAVVVLEP